MNTCVSIRDVAQLAGVAVSTVSRVLNGYPDVSEETRARVQQAVQQLGYRPNHAARTFRTGKTHSVSVILPMIGTDFYNRLINGIDQGLAQRKYDAGLFPLLSPRRLERYRDPSAPPYNADGLILASLNPDRLFEGGKIPADLPTVLVDIAHAAYDSVTVDHDEGGYLAGKHLLERPAPTFVIMVEERFDTPFASGVFRERLEGFQRAFEENSVNLPREHVITVEFSWNGGRLAAKEILRQLKGPTNIFATCDLLAQGLIDEFAHRGIRVGGEVRLVGYDDQPWAEAYGLSTVKQPIESMGRLAARLLLKRLEHPTAEVTHRVLRPQLVVRESSRE